MAPSSLESTLMFAEAAEAAAAVEAQGRAGAAFRSIGDELRRSQPKLVFTCARGSSDHAATFAKYLIETRTGVPVVSAAPSTASIYGAAPFAQDALCIAISQSGRSPDLLASVEALKGGGARVIALVNDESSPLAALADTFVPLAAGQERSVAATKSYIASLAAMVRLVAEWSDDGELCAELERLPDLLRQAWELDWSPLSEGLRDTRSMYVAGRGLGLGVAQEAALKLKETSQIHAEAFSTAELRHGPMALVEPGFPVLLFSQPDRSRESTTAAAADLLRRGGRLFVAGDALDGATALPVATSSAVLAPILQIQSFYRAANALAVACGLDPDRPPHLEKVTRTR